MSWKIDCHDLIVGEKTDILRAGSVAVSSTHISIHSQIYTVSQKWDSRNLQYLIQL